MQFHLGSEYKAFDETVWVQEATLKTCRMISF